MTIGTTPTIIVKLPASVDLSLAETIWATVEQPGIAALEKSGEAITRAAHQASFQLTQGETLQFKPNRNAHVQLNWIYEENKRGCTKIQTLPVEDNLIRRVLP